MLHLEYHRQVRPEDIGNVGMMRGLLLARHQNAVVPQGHPKLPCVVQCLQTPALVGEVIVGRQQCLLKMLLVQIQVQFHRARIVGQPGRGVRVALAPDAERPDVNERHVGIAIVARRGSGQEVVEFLQEDRIVVFRLPHLAAFVDACPRLEVVALSARVPDPLRRGIWLRGI